MALINPSVFEGGRQMQSEGDRGLGVFPDGGSDDGDGGGCRMNKSRQGGGG